MFFRHLSKGDNCDFLLASTDVGWVQGCAVYFCLTCEAEARHRYCFSGVVVVVVDIVGGGINFFVFRSFSQKKRARAMNLGHAYILKS